MLLMRLFMTDIILYVFSALEVVCFFIHLVVSLLTKRAVTSLHTHSAECPNDYSTFAVSYYKSHSSKEELYTHIALFSLWPSSTDIPSSNFSPFSTFLDAVQVYCKNNGCTYSPSIVECLYSATRDVYLKGAK